MDEKLKGTIKRIVQLTQQNPEFDTELRKALGMGPSADFVYEHSVPANVQAIREALEIRANRSINYDFINEERLRCQFYIDNLRMENAALDLRKDENERFYTFCVNAFYQVENIINYYYLKTYPNIEELVSLIIECTKSEKYSFKPNGEEKTVGDIQIVHKSNAFCNCFFKEQSIKLTLSQLRQVRNEGEHRWMTMIQEDVENSPLYKFNKYQTFNTVRIILIKLVDEVKKQLLNTTLIEEGVVANMLPSSCFILVRGSNVVLPQKLFNKVRGLNKGDKVSVSLSPDNKILDVREI